MIMVTFLSLSSGITGMGGGGCDAAAPGGKMSGKEQI
jgi:hypothetical protein